MGLRLRRGGVHGDLVPAHRQRTEYIINDCGAVALITSKYKAEQAAAIIPDTPDVNLRLMLGGSIDGYDSYEQVVDTADSAIEGDRIAGVDMLYSSEPAAPRACR